MATFIINIINHPKTAAMSENFTSVFMYASVGYNFKT